MNQEIKFELNGAHGCFFIENDGLKIAELNFENENNVLNVYHTEVQKELEGQGIAGKLFDEMVKYARENGFKVLPTCSYILVRFRRRPEDFQDIWVRSEDEPTSVVCGVRPKK